MGEKTDLTKEEQRAISALKRVAAIWPASLWIFAYGGPLTVLRLNEEGKRFTTDLGGIDPEYAVASVEIPNDGGDW